MAVQEHKRDFLQIFRGICRSRQPWQVFSDFCEAAAYSLANAVAFDEEREKRYMAIVERSGQAIHEFPKLLGCVVEGLECEPCDFLGTVFQELGLSNHWHGQFFTPYPLARLMAGMTVHDYKEIIDRKGYITLCEPASGAGAMVIACFEALKDLGINPQTAMHVTATDIDPTAARMCFIQISLLYIPAVVHVGNTLSLEVRESYLTPAHVMGGWWMKNLRGGGASQRGEMPTRPAENQYAEKPVIDHCHQNRVQLSMF